MSKFLIVGSGITGCTAGFELAEQGHEVEIIESSSLIGGKVLDYCCKATDECSRCGVCVAHTHIHESLIHENVDLTTGASIESAENNGKKVTLQVVNKNPVINYKACIGCNQCVQACPEGCFTEYRRGEIVQYSIDYSKCRLHRGEECDICVSQCPTGAIEAAGATSKKTLSGDGILVATGHTPFDAALKPRYGYTRSEKVITGLEAEQRLRDQSYLAAPDEDVAFIQCVGSRDPQIDRNYCSSICCSYAMRLSRILKYRNPDSRVTIYYIDLQNFDKNFTLLKQQLIDLGVSFVRGLPFKVEELSSGKLKLLIEDMDEEQESEVFHDMVVLSVGLGPAEDASRTASLLGIGQNQFGFFDTSVENVFIAGTCKEPMSIPDSIASARATALEMGIYKHE
jgi:heterodisulfide reductase subunit A